MVDEVQNGRGVGNTPPTRSYTACAAKAGAQGRRGRRRGLEKRAPVLARCAARGMEERRHAASARLGGLLWDETAPTYSGVAAVAGDDRDARSTASSHTIYETGDSRLRFQVPKLCTHA